MHKRLQKHYHIGIIGTGFIAKGLILSLEHYPNLSVSKVLSRRPKKDLKDLPININQVYAKNLQDLIDNSDLIVECTGDVVYATELIEQVLKSGLPVVTMNSELQVTTGSYLARLGTLVEAEGDQPGTLAALAADVTDMGFKPLVYGNIKGFLNLNPSRADMEYWSRHNGITLDKVTAFTDGTKVEVEQALVANGLGATIPYSGMSALECNSYEDGAQVLGNLAASMGQTISDYVVCNGAPAGVFIVATHDSAQAPYLKYLKLGDGPHYVIVKPFHLCHLEIAKTIIHVLSHSSDYVFNNGINPKIQVVAVAKRDLNPGEFIQNGVGSFEVRGKALEINKSATSVPIGLLQKATITKPIKAGDSIRYSDIDMPKTRALAIWKEILREQNLLSPSEQDRVIMKSVRQFESLSPTRKSLFSFLNKEIINQPLKIKS